MTVQGILVRMGLAAVLFLILIHALKRDIRYSGYFPDDLRNRIVGARLVKDGLDPYTNKWKKGDGFRYYDPTNFDSLTVSRVTVSPFFLHLLSPIADMPFSALSLWWLALEYFAVAVLVAIALWIARDATQQWTVLVFAVLFLMTNAWKDHVLLGQNYILTTFLFALLFFCMRRGDTPLLGFVTGCCAACLVFTRINGLFFLLPFVFLFRAYSRQWKLAFCVAPLLLLGWTLLSPRERGLWQGYSYMLSEQIRAHQGLPTHLQKNDPDPGFPYFEGIDYPAAEKARADEPDKFKVEHGNVFHLYEAVFKRRIPVPVLTGICCGLIGLLFLLFFVRHRPFTALSLEKTAFFGCCLYMISDLFSPVYRYQYPAVQWLFPLLLAAAVCKGEQRIACWILLAGILLNSWRFPLIRMPNTTGEILFLVVLLTLSFMSARRQSGFPKGGQKYCTSSG